MTNNELIEYYAKLLILQYKGMPKAEATIRAFLKIICILELIDSIEEGYNIDDAVGVQLDVLGKYIGVSRIIIGISFERTYFGFIGYGDDPAFSQFAGFMGYGQNPDNSLAFSDGSLFELENNYILGILNTTGYSETPPDVQFFGYGDGQKSILTLLDEEYRILLKFKILINYSNCSLKEIDDFLYNIYGDDVFVTDGMNKILRYTFPTQNIRLASILKFTNCLPKSAGTSIVLDFSPTT